MKEKHLQIIDRKGLIPYAHALREQLEMVEERKKGLVPDTLIILEHPPVITLGRNADPAGVVASPDVLEAQGISVHRVERGGQVTYHGPGQLVGYPIIDIRARGLGVSGYVRLLEETLIHSAAALGVEAHRRSGITGVFCDAGKIGAIGVRISGGVTYHGFALNVDPNLGHYRLIVPCGMPDIPVTAIACVRGDSPSMREARRVVIDAFGRVFD